MNRLNVNKINNNQNVSVISSFEALKDVTPLSLPENVLSGEKKIIIDKMEKVDKSTCVKLGISYL